MNSRFLNKLIAESSFLDFRIDYYLRNRLIKKQKSDENEIKGHLEKAEHNLQFVKDNLKMNYLDWCITGCYYAVYHSALALILKKGYSSKNHDATLCVLIKEYYGIVDKEDVELINKFYLDYQDLLFYVSSKQKRQDSTYSSSYKFDKKEVENLRLESIEFVNKVKEILNEN